jgi:CheY-like chemotaxis protein
MTEPGPQQTSARKTVLVLEDETDFRRILVTTIKRAGYFVYEAADAQQALLQLGPQKPDMVLLDIDLDGADGWQAAHLLRRVLGDDLPIAAHTAADVSKQAKDFVGILRKPIDVAEVTNFLVQHIGPGMPRGGERRRVMDRRVMQIPVQVDKRSGIDRRTGIDRRAPGSER